jgi:type IV secretory pathway VirB2 component (pilin)
MKKREMILLGLFVALIFFAQDAFAYGEEIESSLNNLINWVTKVIGGAAIVGGIVWTGIRMSMGDENAIKNGLKVIGGGILIFSAKWILELLQGIFKA